MDDFDNEGRKVCCKVSLYKNCQLQSCRAFNCLSSGINILAGGQPLHPEILPTSDLPSPVNGILWEMSELITQDRRIYKLRGGVDHVTRHVCSLTKVKRSQGHVTYQQQ